VYTTKNFRSKKELKLAVEKYNLAIEAEKNGPVTVLSSMGDVMVAGKPRPVTYFQPGPFGGNESKDGTFCCEGPHFPEPHRWYATCTAKDGVIIKVK
jgi:hypothetical protein